MCQSHSCVNHMFVLICVRREAYCVFELRMLESVCLSSLERFCCVYQVVHIFYIGKDGCDCLVYGNLGLLSGPQHIV